MALLLSEVQERNLGFEQMQIRRASVHHDSNNHFVHCLVNRFIYFNALSIRGVNPFVFKCHGNLSRLP